jgi:transcriptional repressor NrdR
LKVRKRDGRIQDFNLGKIRLTIERVSDEVQMPLTGSDLDMISKSIERDLASRGEDIIDTAQIGKTVVAQLEDFGYKKIAVAYQGYTT